jgi:hypothetical protein
MRLKTNSNSLISCLTFAGYFEKFLESQSSETNQKKPTLCRKEIKRKKKILEKKEEIIRRKRGNERSILGIPFCQKRESLRNHVNALFEPGEKLLSLSSLVEVFLAIGRQHFVFRRGQFCSHGEIERNAGE